MSARERPFAAEKGRSLFCASVRAKRVRAKEAQARPFAAEAGRWQSLLSSFCGGSGPLTPSFAHALFCARPLLRLTSFALARSYVLPDGWGGVELLSGKKMTATQCVRAIRRLEKRRSVKPSMLVEEYIPSPANGLPTVDYKFWMFGGKVRAATQQPSETFLIRAHV